MAHQVLKLLQQKPQYSWIVWCHKNSWIYLTSTYYWWLLRPTISIRFDLKWQKKHYSHSTTRYHSCWVTTWTTTTSCSEDHVWRRWNAHKIDSSVNNLRAWYAYFTPPTANEVPLLWQALNLRLKVHKPNEPVTLGVVSSTVAFHLNNTSNNTGNRPVSTGNIPVSTGNRPVSVAIIFTEPLECSLHHSETVTSFH